ncbi:MAG TPA: 2-polyprenyl-3-methyl-6-methoxy-1,4-benzoquinone monooxygenase [Burkholderiales bacterium]|nr:2-polyprenyl-3-methyl-6-methoxy-1,4-benzoquinone monooxygenase [Burkholderiales bacterium]
MVDLDRLIVSFDRGLRTLFAPALSVRAVPGDELPEAEMQPAQREHAAALMRVNHTGEICAQALYQGQALTARSSQAASALERAAQEETEHLAWTERRIEELGGRKSLLNPVWYAGSFAIGAVAGLLGDRVNLGFLAETERQVVEHLDGHLKKLPAADEKSRAIVGEMRMDEARHATSAVDHGAGDLPAPARLLMRVASGVMTRTSYYL